MSFPRYPSYKDSGVEWLGEVPEHWEVIRARNLGVFSGSGIDKKTVEGEQPVKMFNYLDIYNSIDKTLPYSPDLMDTTAPAEKAIEHAVRRGDILLTPSSETSDDVGHAARVLDMPEGVVYSYHILRFRGTGSTDPAFLTYSFNAAPTRSYFASVCTGTTRMVLGREDFKSAPVAKPPLPEQTQIAAFLDRETAKIDELVAEQRRLMELLKEKRQAVISHAVTKGLNPDAPMKPSGIEWLGEVPAHWEVKRLNRLIRNGTAITYGIVQAGPHHEGGIPYIRTSDMAGDSLPIDGYPLTSPEIDAGYRRSKVQSGDLVIAIRATIGKCLPVPPELDGANLTQGTAKIAPGDQIRPEYLQTSLSANSTQAYFGFMAKGATFKEITIDALRRTPIPVPPIDEQEEILFFLRSELAKFDSLTAEAQRAIDLLQERRTALISAAVTGQIDVRGLSQTQVLETAE